MCSVARLERGTQAAERGDVLVELPLSLLRDPADRLVQRQVGIVLRRARVDLVVDVGDVAHIGDVVGAVEMAQQPEQHVEHDDRPRIADMGEVIDRRPTYIRTRAGSIGANGRFARRVWYSVSSIAPRHPIAIVRLDLSGAETEQVSPGLAGRASQTLDQENRRPQPAQVASK